MNVFKPLEAISIISIILLESEKIQNRILLLVLRKVSQIRNMGSAPMSFSRKGKKKIPIN